MAVSYTHLAVYKRQEQMLPKMDSILYSLNKILADPALGATLHLSLIHISCFQFRFLKIKHFALRLVMRYQVTRSQLVQVTFRTVQKLALFIEAKHVL